jgi:hypothetical protein
MKSKLLTVVSFLSLTVARAQAAFSHPVAQSEADFLYAVRQVESGDRYDCPPGRAGELGAYQFRREVWSKYTRTSFAQAQTSVSDEIAARHYDWIVTQLRARGIAPNSWNVAATWNGGLGAVTTRRLAPSTRDYANRVTNLVVDEVRLRKSLTPTFQIALASAN